MYLFSCCARRESHVIIMILDPLVSRVNTADHTHGKFCVLGLVNERAQDRT